MAGARARVLVKRSSACEGCSGCGILGQTMTDLMISADAQAIPDLAAGDEVELESLGRGLLGNALLVYGLPLIGFMSGILLTSFWGCSELTALFWGAVGLIVFFIPALVAERWINSSGVDLFRITRRTNR